MKNLQYVFPQLLPSGELSATKALLSDSMQKFAGKIVSTGVPEWNDTKEKSRPLRLYVRHLMFEKQVRENCTAKREERHRLKVAQVAALAKIKPYEMNSEQTAFIYRHVPKSKMDTIRAIVNGETPYKGFWKSYNSSFPFAQYARHCVWVREEERKLLS